eukprot:UN05379
MLTAAVMSRDMGTPVRKFILALDDKYKFLLPLFRDGRIPGINKNVHRMYGILNVKIWLLLNVYFIFYVHVI